MSDPRKPVSDADEPNAQEPKPVETSRRAVVAGIAVALAATAARLGPEEAKADDGQPLVLGIDNNAAQHPTGLTLLSSDPAGGDQSAALVVHNPQTGPGVVGLSGLVAGPPAVTYTAILGISEAGRGVVGVGGTRDFAYTVTITAMDSVGVIGAGGPDALAGVVGLSDAGRGVIGIGGIHDQASVPTATAELFDLGRFGVAGASAVGTGGGVLGLSFRDGSGIGATLTANIDYGLRGIATAPDGVAVLAENPGGVALRVLGRLQMQTAGEHVIPAGQKAPLLVANPDVTGQSHVTVTFTVLPNPKSLHVLFIERIPGVGFTLHLKGKAKIPVPFTWSVVEPSS